MTNEVADRAPEIAKTAGEKNGFDRVIVGMARLLLGYVTSEVAAKAHCSVTIAR
jgi:hypothetical protein